MTIFWEEILKVLKIEINAIDVGCSNSRPFEWDKIGSALKYVGVDPLTREIDRLKNLGRPNSRYIAAFICAEGSSGRSDSGANRFYNRSSAAKEVKESFDFIREQFNDGREVLYTNERLSPGDILNLSGIKELDLLKIDVDGDDFPIFNEFLKIESGATVLAVDIESQFHGDPGPFGNTFANISIRASEADLHLFKLESFTYSRSALPLPYVYDFPAQTVGGQTLWGDAVFMRDFYQRTTDFKSIIKMIVLYDIYGLHDCAYELLIENSKLFGDEALFNRIKSYLEQQVQDVWQPMSHSNKQTKYGFLLRATGRFNFWKLFQIKRL